MMLSQSDTQPMLDGNTLPDISESDQWKLPEKKSALKFFLHPRSYFHENDLERKPQIECK
jgi:hypothetical protein